jgi:putative ABC transport system permease protein
MNTINRGIRNAFRNQVRTLSIVVILGLSIGLSLTMLIAHQAVGQKINTVKSKVGNTISIEPAGFGGGFGSGGTALTETELSPVAKLSHVVSLSESLSDRLTTGTNTSLKSGVSLGNLGRRFEGAGSTTTTTGGGGGNFPGAGSTSTLRTTTTLKSGKAFSGTSDSDVAFVGTTLASKNSLKVGSTFTAYNTTITVVGIFDAGSTFANNQIIMPLATEQRLSSQAGDITTATATVDSVNNLSSVTKAIQVKLGSSTADVTDDVTTAETTIQPLEDVSSISLYSLIGAVIAGGVIVLLTMVMIVRERRREIGIFKALGASNLKVMLQFMSEAVTLTLLGAVLGILLGVMAGNPITKLLVNNSSSSSTTSTSTFGGPMGGGGGGFGGGSFHHGSFGSVQNSITNIHATVGFSIILYGILAALVIALIGSSAVSYFITKIRPAEVMRSE